jgi:hypothetical protein
MASPPVRVNHVEEGRRSADAGQCKPCERARRNQWLFGARLNALRDHTHLLDASRTDRI